MEECSVCGITRNRARIYDAISSKGIVSACEACANENDWMIVKRPTNLQVTASKADGVSFRKSVQNFEKMQSEKRKGDTTQEDVTLKDLINKNFQRKLPKETKKRDDLATNFHWIIMRARRSMKITSEQLAKAINEPEMAIKMAEKGIVPENDYRLINKLEAFLKIRILKDRSKAVIPVDDSDFDEKAEVFSKDDAEFDPVSTKMVKISDIKRLINLKGRKKYEIEESPFKFNDIRYTGVEEESSSEEDYYEKNSDEEKRRQERLDTIKREIDKQAPNKEKTNYKDKKELSRDEMNKLIFGK